MEESPRRGRFTYVETQKRLDRILLQERRFTEDEKGEILLFKEPEQGRPYTLGGDTAGEGSDSFTVQVIDTAFRGNS